MDSNGSQPHDDSLTDAEVEARMLSPELIAKGLEGASPELAVKIVTDFQRLSQAVALRDQSLAADPRVQIEREAIKTARLFINTLATMPDRDEQVAWLAHRLVMGGESATVGAHVAAVQTVARMLDAQTPDDEHLDKVADALLRELGETHPENVSARRQLVRRAFGVVLRRDADKGPSTGQYI